MIATKEINDLTGKFVRLNYNSKIAENSQTGIVSKKNRKEVLFKINKSRLEIPVEYKKITNITEL